MSQFNIFSGPFPISLQYVHFLFAFLQQRIRHMQSVFNRERNKFRRSYEAWRENGPPGGYNYVPRDDWYWQTDTSHSEHKNRRTYTPAGPRVYSMSHHYTVLGLNRYLFKSLAAYFCSSVNILISWYRYILLPYSVLSDLWFMVL